jgi:hypothetical protein
MTLKNVTTKSRFKIKLKTKIEKSKYPVLVATHNREDIIIPNEYKVPKLEYSVRLHNDIT